MSAGVIGQYRTVIELLVDPGIFSCSMEPERQTDRERGRERGEDNNNEKGKGETSRSVKSPWCKWHHVEGRGTEKRERERERVKTHLVYDTAVRPSLGYDCMEGPIVHMLQYTLSVPIHLLFQNGNKIQSATLGLEHTQLEHPNEGRGVCQLGGVTSSGLKASKNKYCPGSSVGRAVAKTAECRRFESHLGQGTTNNSTTPRTAFFRRKKELP